MVERWSGRKEKHQKDHNHGKRGRVGGNPRYQRTRATEFKNRTMGKN